MIARIDQIDGTQRPGFIIVTVTYLENDEFVETKNLPFDAEMTQIQMRQSIIKEGLAIQASFNKANTLKSNIPLGTTIEVK